jgi:hypothetical protein
MLQFTFAQHTPYSKQSFGNTTDILQTLHIRKKGTYMNTSHCIKPVEQEYKYMKYVEVHLIPCLMIHFCLKHIWHHENKPTNVHCPTHSCYRSSPFTYWTGTFRLYKHNCHCRHRHHHHHYYCAIEFILHSFSFFSSSHSYFLQSRALSKIGILKKLRTSYIHIRTLYLVI